MAEDDKYECGAAQNVVHLRRYALLGSGREKMAEEIRGPGMVLVSGEVFFAFFMKKKAIINCTQPIFFFFFF